MLWIDLYAIPKAYTALSVCYIINPPMSLRCSRGCIAICAKTGTLRWGWHLWSSYTDMQSGWILICLQISFTDSSFWSGRTEESPSRAPWACKGHGDLHTLLVLVSHPCSLRLTGSQAKNLPEGFYVCLRAVLCLCSSVSWIDSLKTK